MSIGAQRGGSGFVCRHLSRFGIIGNEGTWWCSCSGVSVLSYRGLRRWHSDEMSVWCNAGNSGFTTMDLWEKPVVPYIIDIVCETAQARASSGIIVLVGITESGLPPPKTPRLIDCLLHRILDSYTDIPYINHWFIDV